MESFSARLLTWYDRHARDLPWRVGPKHDGQRRLPDPYHVWLSEVMLQQTTVATVKSYFEKFVDKWPTVNDLAAADIDDVMKAWAGLGYYSRARNLKACADIVAGDLAGQFPRTQTELQALPGIGDYTSAAISAIAFGIPARVVDGNIERVSTRHGAISTPMPKAKEYCRAFMGSATPHDRPGDFVQAMMDLGATICTPKSPACALCPVNEDCHSRRAGTMLDFPVKAPKKSKPTRLGAAYVAVHPDGSIWLTRRPDEGLLGGMAAVPTTKWTSSIDGETGTLAAPAAVDWIACGTVRHTFTHFHLDLEIWRGTCRAVNGDGWWSPPHQVGGEALPTVFKKAISQALPDAFREKAEGNRP